jgi:hypothetical protein
VLAVGQRRANDRCRKRCRSVQRFYQRRLPQASTMFQRRMPQETPQRPTMDAARFNDACRRNAAAANDRRRRNAATVSHRKTAPKTHPEKTAFRGWFTWQSEARCELCRRVVLPGVTGRVRLPLRSGAARRTAIASPGSRPPKQSPFHLAAAAAPVLCLRSGASVVPAVSAISMPLLLILMNKGRGGRRWRAAPPRPERSTNPVRRLLTQGDWL